MNTQSDKWVIAAVATTTGAIFLADLLTPLGIAVPMLYVCPILLTWFTPGSRSTTVIAGCSFILTMLGLAFSFSEITFAVAADRMLVTGLLIIVASLLVVQKGSAQQIAAVQRAKHESEERFRKVFEGAAEGIAITDMAGNMVMCNAAYSGITGYSQEELVDHVSSSLIYPDDQAENLELVRQLCEGSRASFEIENRYITKSGDPIWVRKHVSLLRNDQEAPIYLVKLATDITQRKRDEEALRRQQERLEALTAKLLTAQEDERRRIAGELHDDLTQRMATLTIDLQSLSRSTGASEPSPDTRLHRAGKMAEQVTTDLQRLAHQLHSSLLEHAGLEAAVLELVQEFETRAVVKTNVVVRNFPAVLSPDRATCLYRVLQECLHNVRKHANASQVLVRLLGTRGGVGLCVRDDGCGFDVTPESAGKRKGLGLISLGERLGMLNGTFRIQSTRGCGTEVHAWIPLEQRNVSGEGGEAEADP